MLSNVDLKIVCIKFLIHRISLLMVLLLLVCCSIGKCSTNVCQIDGDIEYLCATPLIILHSEDENVVLPTPYVDYNISDISDVVFNSENKVGKGLNICPPVALIN